MVSGPAGTLRDSSADSPSESYTLLAPCTSPLRQHKTTVTVIVYAKPTDTNVLCCQTIVPEGLSSTTPIMISTEGLKPVAHREKAIFEDKAFEN